MPPRRPPPDPETLRRAVRMACLPMVRRSDVCARFDLSPARLRRALADLAAGLHPTRADLLLHHLSDAGRVSAGPRPDLAGVASWLDYVNKDGSTAADVRALLDELVSTGRIALDEEGWRLTSTFP